MKIKELREMSDAELTVKLGDLKQELFNLRFNHTIGQLSNPMQINTCKKDIARIKTILRDRELEAKKKLEA
ncbi:MAG: 50S ribosomal protein L29 [Clostridia bacterium]|nr:50S ribosomal protein L29 [Clostridia bacterium]